MGGPSELRGVFRSPLGFLMRLGRTLDVGGGYQAAGGQPVAILLAFHDENCGALRDRSAEFRQAVEYGRTGASLVDPGSGSRTMADAKVFGGVANFLANLDVYCPKKVFRLLREYSGHLVSQDGSRGAILQAAV